MFLLPLTHCSLVKSFLKSCLKEQWSCPHLNLKNNGIIIPKWWGSNSSNEGWPLYIVEKVGRAKIKQVECWARQHWGGDEGAEGFGGDIIPSQLGPPHSREMTLGLPFIEFFHLFPLMITFLSLHKSLYKILLLMSDSFSESNLGKSGMLSITLSFQGSLRGQLFIQPHFKENTLRVGNFGRV